MQLEQTLTIQHLKAGYPNKTVLHDISFPVQSGKITVLIGANGCGKSTLLNCIAGLHPSQSGDILLHQHSLSSLSRRERAKKIALLPQFVTAPLGMTVEHLVQQGRYPYRGWFGRWSEADQQATDDALKWTGLTNQRQAALTELSGGQRQRAWLALTLAQQSDVILLDEPISMLDIGHQVEVLERLRDFAEHGKTILMVLHDLAAAARCADYLVAMDQGRILAQGRPKTVLSSQNLQQMYQLDADVIDAPNKRSVLVIPKQCGDVRSSV